MPVTKILLIVAYIGYQPTEYEIPKKTFKNAGYTVVTASNKPGTATASNNSKTTVDLTLEQVNTADYKAIIFIGGPGALDNLDTQASYQIINEAVEAGILMGAICIAPRILAHAGVLSFVNATGWDGDNELKGVFDEYDVSRVQAPVVADQGFVTADGPPSAQAFADEIVRQLKS